MNKDTLFSNFSEVARLEIWVYLTEIDYLIPILKTFFKDWLYLKVTQYIMKRLFVQLRGEKLTID